MGGFLIIYTVTGGAKAVAHTQKIQMLLVFTTLGLIIYSVIKLLPDGQTIAQALKQAATYGKMNTITTGFTDKGFNWNDKYNIFSGIIGGFFLALSYFGTDQSQVQRYLTGKSVKESQLGLMFNAVLKIPMQFFILFIGVMVFVFFEFNNTPINFNPQVENYLEQSQNPEYLIEKEKFISLRKEKRSLQQKYIDNIDFGVTKNLEKEIKQLHKNEKEIRENVKDITKKIAPQSIESNDLDYVFIFFILNYLPKGIIGLLLAVILSAAMSSTASELNALSTTTVIDIYKRNHIEKKSEKHYLRASKWFTVMWGLIAIIFASFGSLFENLIQLVNLIGSIFYGTILGIFIVAFFFKKIKGNQVFYAACISQISIFMIYGFMEIGYLWLNFIGAFLTIFISNLLKRD